MKLSIVVLNFKKKELTIECIKSLYLQYKNEFVKNEFEVIAIDNFSQDGSVQYLKKEIIKNKFINIFILPSSKNLGFGAGCNLGAMRSKGKYILFLNNDTKVLDNGFSGMTDFLDSHVKVGILGGKMENENQSSQPSAGKFYTIFNAIIFLLGLQRIGLTVESPSKIKKVDWVSGGCMMVKKDVFEKIKGFDENIFMYVEDMDICFRLKEADYATYFYPFVKVEHVGQASSNRTFAIVNIYEGLMKFYRKNMPDWQIWLMACILKSKALILIFIGKLLNNNYLVSTYEKAIAVI